MSSASPTSPPKSSYSSGDLQKLLGDVITHQTSLADIDLLLTAGADPNGEVRQGLRPLHYAAFQVCKTFHETLTDVNRGPLVQCCTFIWP